MSTPFSGTTTLTPEEFDSRRNFILELLNALYLDFGNMDLLKDAGPHLQELMTLVYYARPGEEQAKIASSVTRT